MFSVLCTQNLGKYFWTVSTSGRRIFQTDQTAFLSPTWPFSMPQNGLNYSMGFLEPNRYADSTASRHQETTINTLTPRKALAPGVFIEPNRYADSTYDRHLPRHRRIVQRGRSK
jgi:hypothetical protein